MSIFLPKIADEKKNELNAPLEHIPDQTTKNQIFKNPQNTTFKKLTKIADFLQYFAHISPKNRIRKKIELNTSFEHIPDLTIKKVIFSNCRIEQLTKIAEFLQYFAHIS